MMFTIVHVNFMLIWFSLRMMSMDFFWGHSPLMSPNCFSSWRSSWFEFHLHLNFLQCWSSFPIMKKIITRSSLLMFPNWFSPWSWPPLYICMYEFHSAFIFLNDYSVSKLLFTMIFSIVKIPFLIFFWWWWWWWISFVNSHFVRSKTYCCCRHCIEVMEFKTHTHTLLEWIPIVSLCSCVTLIASPRTHKIQKSFLAPNCRHGREMLCCLFFARRFQSSRKNIFAVSINTDCS